MMSFDWKLRKCHKSSRLLRPCCVDRLNSLPDEILARLLSMLPTKDAAVTQVLSKRMRQAFTWISSVDLDESPISHCIKRPHLAERFPLFESFVDTVLRKLSHPLTRFRLRLGGDIDTHLQLPSEGHICDEACFPHLEPARLNLWVSYPLTHCGLRELDLSFHVRNHSQCTLPPGLFACQSVEVLRLDSNLVINDADFPVICLPKLKLLHLNSFVFSEDDFVTRLVSSCPALEDLSISYCWWVQSDRLTICSHSLRRLVLIIFKYDEEQNSNLVLIDTPNLHYMEYIDNISYCYSVSHLNMLDEARISFVVGLLNFEPLEASFRSQLCFARALSNVRHLSLLGTSAENFYLADEFKDEFRDLPVYHNLKTLELGEFFNARWSIVLLLILRCSPVLETLVFPEGLFENIYGIYRDLEAAALEAEGWRTNQTIPSCCLTHLKRILFKRFFGIDRELSMIKFLLSKCSVLEELVICLSTDFRVPLGVQFDAPNLDQFESTLGELPKASDSCSIIVHR